MTNYELRCKPVLLKFWERKKWGRIFVFPDIITYLKGKKHDHQMLGTIIQSLLLEVSEMLMLWAADISIINVPVTIHLFGVQVTFLLIDLMFFIFVIKLWLFFHIDLLAITTIQFFMNHWLQVVCLKIPFPASKCFTRVKWYWWHAYYFS